MLNLASYNKVLGNLPDTAPFFGADAVISFGFCVPGAVPVFVASALATVIADRLTTDCASYIAFASRKRLS